MNLKVNLVSFNELNKQTLVNLPITKEDHIIDFNLLKSKLTTNDVYKYIPSKNVLNFYLLIAILQVLTKKDSGDIYYIINNDHSFVIKEIKNVFNILNSIIDNKFDFEFIKIKN